MGRWFRSALTLIALLILSSCSLFKFTVSVGDKPMSDQEQSIRIMVRGFYNEFTRSVIAASDTIAIKNDNIVYKINALQWKMRSTAACADAAFGGIPEVTLINTWVLCKRMKEYMDTEPDTLLFGQKSKIARGVSDILLNKIENQARKYISSNRYLLMDSFVNEYAVQNPMHNLEFTPTDLTLEWADYQPANSRELLRGVGSISEVMADMNERVSGYSNQFSNEIKWGGQKFSMEMAQDSLRDKLSLKLDSISYNFNKMVLIFEHSPQLINAITTDLNVQMQGLIGALNGSVNSAFHNIANERIALQEFVDQQRAVLIKDMQLSVDMAIKSAMDSLPTLVGKILIYIVLVLTVLFSIPFFAGFMLGKWLERRNHKKSANGEQ